MSKPSEMIRIAATPWWIRKAIYAVVLVVGLVLTLVGKADPQVVEGWLGEVGSFAAVIGGLVGTLFTNRHSDEVVEVVAGEPAAPDFVSVPVVPEMVGSPLDLLAAVVQSNAPAAPRYESEWGGGDA